jgi:hypothetical protein
MARKSRHWFLPMTPDIPAMQAVTESILARGDLAHLALFLWASGASALLVHCFREIAAANRRFDTFVRELARFNRRYEEPSP